MVVDDQYQEAAGAFRKAVAVEPNSRMAWSYLAMLLRHRLSDPMGAEVATQNARSAGHVEMPIRMIALTLEGPRQEARAVETARKYAQNPEAVRESVDRAPEVFIPLAAAGLGNECLDVIATSPNAGILAPVAAGIQIHLGRDEAVPKEMLGIGGDIAARIRKEAESRDTRIPD